MPALILRALHLVVMDPREADAQGGSGVVMNRIQLVSTELDNTDKKQRREMKCTMNCSVLLNNESTPHSVCSISGNRTVKLFGGGRTILISNSSGISF